MLFRSTLLAASTTLILVPAAADTVELSGGGHVSGVVSEPPDGKVVIVQVDEDLRVAVPASRVRRIIRSEELTPYEQAAAKAGNDAERHYQLGIACLRQPNFPGDSDIYRRYHMRRAIELDPEHSEARGSLGYKKEKGQWVRVEDLWRRRGMIRSGGQWQLPEAVAIEKAQDAADEGAKRWTKKIARLTGIIRRGRGDVAAAYGELGAIEDPLAAEGVAKQLEESREDRSQSRDLRMLWVKLLGRFRNRIAVRALVKTGIEEPDDFVREAALTELQEYGASSAVATYLPMLKSNDNSVVNRAARALSWFPDRELALNYADALVTEHKKVGPAGPGMSVGLGNDGSGGLSMGGKQQVVVSKKQNPAVLALLTTIEPDANYGYDESAWRQHFANRLTTYQGDLRRDP